MYRALLQRLSRSFRGYDSRCPESGVMHDVVVRCAGLDSAELWNGLRRVLPAPGGRSSGGEALAGHAARYARYVLGPEAALLRQCGAHVRWVGFAGRCRRLVEIVPGGV